MYAEFSYDLVPGLHPNDFVLGEILKAFETTPTGDARLRCDVLSDTFICQIVNTRDYEATDQRLRGLRTQLNDQFSYTFSLRSRGDPMRIRGTHNAALAKQIIDG